MSTDAIPVSESNPHECTPDHACEHHDADHEHGPDCGTMPSRTATTSTTWSAVTCTTRTATTATTTDQSADRSCAS